MIPVRNNDDRIPPVVEEPHLGDPLDHAVRDLAAEVFRNPPELGADIEEVEELRREPLSLEQVMNLPEHLIEGLFHEQLVEVDNLLSNHTQQLFELVQQQPAKIADEWALKLFALGCNEYIARKQAHVMIISALVDAIRYHNLSAGWDAIHEQSRRQFAALARQDDALDQLREERERWEAESQAALDKMREDLKEIERRLLAEQADAPPVDPHDVIGDQYAESQAADAVERRDDPPNDDGWHPCWLIAAIIGCLAIAYGWFRGRGDAPTKGE